MPAPEPVGGGHAPCQENSLAHGDYYGGQEKDGPPFSQDQERDEADQPGFSEIVLVHQQPGRRRALPYPGKPMILDNRQKSTRCYTDGKQYQMGLEILDRATDAEHQPEYPESPEVIQGIQFGYGPEHRERSVEQETQPVDMGLGPLKLATEKQERDREAENNPLDAVAGLRESFVEQEG